MATLCRARQAWSGIARHCEVGSRGVRLGLACHGRLRGALSREIPRGGARNGNAGCASPRIAIAGGNHREMGNVRKSCAL